MLLLQYIENICHLFYFLDLLLLFCFSTILENLYMIPLYVNLFYEAYNSTHEHCQKHGYFLLMYFLMHIDTSAKENLNFLQ